jgi:uncharacterized LabA/DUF88 family protein
LSKNVAVFVDVANLYYSARGQDVDVDYVALLKAATKGRDLIRAYAYSGLDPENENQRKFIDFLGKNGYKVVIKDIRKFGDGRVKANLDIELVVDLFRLADRMDIAVVISGDGDFAPAIRALQDKGVRCEVISFRPNTSSDLLAVADEFIDIMKVIGIGREKKRTGMSAPAMPAKEVTPEFGFREASPQIAAAALAALKGTPDRRAEPAVSRGNGEIDEAGDGESADRKRRRRRGGRGRGRGRGREVAVEAGAAEGDAQDQALDDLAEIAEFGEEREYSFSEADPETLAELGLLGQPDGTKPPDVAAGEEQAATATASPETVVKDGEPPEAKPKARRRRTTRKKAEPEPAEPDGASNAPTAEGAEPAATKPKPRRRTKRAAAETGDGAEAAPAEQEQEDKPRRRRTTRSATAQSAETSPPEKPRSRSRRRSASTPEASGTGDEAPGTSDDASQGIWQRFRSARGGSGSR